MCPFSHGYFFVFSVCCCLQLLNVYGHDVNYVYHQDKSATRHTLLSLLLLPPPPPPPPSAVEQGRQTDGEQMNSRGIHSAPFAVLQPEGDRGGQVAQGPRLPNRPVSSLQSDHVIAAANGLFRSIPGEKKQHLSSLPQILDVTRPFRTGVARPFRTGVVIARSFRPSGARPFRTGAARPFRTDGARSSFRTGGAKSLRTDFLSAGKSALGGNPTKEDRSGDGHYSNSFHKIKNDGFLQQPQLVLSSQIHSRSKRSPKRNKHPKKQGRRDNEMATMPAANNDTTATHVTYTHVESVRTKVTGKTGARARRRQKGRHPTTVNKLPHLAEGDDVVERKVTVASRGDSSEKYASNWNVLENLTSPAFPIVLPSEREKVDVTNQGHPIMSSSQQQVNSKQKGPEIVMAKSDAYIGQDGKPLNLTGFVNVNFLKDRDFQRQLDRQAQWAYMCLVILICLMMWTMWCLGGLNRCRYRPNDVAHFLDNPHTLAVEEVLKRRHKYLPMFNEPEWEEVLMCNRGSDP